MATDFLELDDDDRALIAAATELLRTRYVPSQHTVAAAVRTARGAVHTGVNLDSTGLGPCAETVAIGAAVTAGHTAITAVVAVHRRDQTYRVLSPCGNCRQLMLDYAPDAMVILNVDGRDVKAAVADLLPGAYTG